MMTPPKAEPCLSHRSVAVRAQAFYLQLRADTSPHDGTPITARQLESLVRLAEARARAELRATVTRRDAEVRGGDGGHPPRGTPPSPHLTSPSVSPGSTLPPTQPGQRLLTG